MEELIDWEMVVRQNAKNKMAIFKMANPKDPKVESGGLEGHEELPHLAPKL